MELILDSYDLLLLLMKTIATIARGSSTNGSSEREPFRVGGRGAADVDLSIASNLYHKITVI